MSDGLFLEIEDFLNRKIDKVPHEIKGNVAPCERCGLLCKLSPKPNSKSRVAKRADKIKGGLCVNCSVTSFIKSVETLNYIISIKGPRILLDEAARSQFSSIMATGKSDADPSEINWDAIVSNWELPFNKIKRGKKKK